ncbi:hypothetical protein MuYL_0555 [Mucilaginibacter xinganensis]|uniref:Uncharacterized protein n=1 Tax=Mucilaginibacter xinganensis TaxID=1234841 RepID=A0A223NS23_9SPHI|nr:hypothetical protein MuYL_0555 [Mucilaginibacter xinganensis]
MPGLQSIYTSNKNPLGRKQKGFKKSVIFSLKKVLRLYLFA